MLHALDRTTDCFIALAARNRVNVSVTVAILALSALSARLKAGQETSALPARNLRVNVSVAVAILESAR